MERPRKAPYDGASVWVPTGSFTAQVDGTDTSFVADMTRVSRAWLDESPDGRNIAHLFRPIRLHFDVEQATAAPGEVRG